MIDSSTHALLCAIIRRESRSLLQYVRESFPWTTSEERTTLAQLDKLIDEECRVLAALTRFLVRQHFTPPYLGSFPSSFTTVNYLSLDHLLPILVGRQRQAVEKLEGNLACLTDADARREVQNVLNMKRKHLDELEKLAMPRREKAAG